MYVCLCKAITEKEIRLKVQEGANTLSKIRECCQAGKGCGACIEQIFKILGEGSSTSPET